MAKFVPLARPYALAAFDYAKEHDQLLEWNAFLSSLSNVVQDKTINKLLKNPEATTEVWIKFISDLLKVNKEQQNFLRMLAENKRLLIAPEITELFKEYLSALEKISQVRIVTALELDSSYKDSLKEALVKRMKHQVHLKCEVDPSILGGAVIQMGDKVIDGSIKGKLNRLRQDLTG